MLLGGGAHGAAQADVAGGSAEGERGLGALPRDLHGVGGAGVGRRGFLGGVGATVLEDALSLVFFISFALSLSWPSG